MTVKNDRPASPSLPPRAPITPKSAPLTQAANTASAKGAAPSAPSASTSPSTPLVPNSKSLQSFSALTGGAAPAKSADLASVRSDYKVPARGDLQYDGVFVGAQGQTFDPKTPLKDLKGILPDGGARSSEKLMFVNGINTTLASEIENMKNMANKTGCEVIGVHNATGGMITDLAQCVTDKLDKGSNPPVDTMANAILKELGEGRGLHLMAHSQGALVAGRALKHVSENLRLEGGKSAAEVEQLMSKVKVETFGGAEARFVDGPQYVHYVNNRDLVPTAFGQGDGKHIDELFRYGGKDAKIVRFEDDGGNALNPIAAHNLKEVYLEHRVPFQEARDGKLPAGAYSTL